VLSVIVLVAGILAMSGSLYAHHGDAAYNPNPLILKGAVVTEFTWMNPHSLIKVDYKNDKGAMEHWTMEIGSTPSMALLGWRKTTLKPGDIITAYLFQTKNGNTVGRVNKIILADGTVLGDRDDATPSRYGDAPAAGAGAKGGRQ
jgi:hypothetical protein